MANEIAFPEDPEIRKPEKNKKNHRRFPLRVSLFIAVVLPAFLVPSILLGAKWMKNRIVSEIDEKLEIRKSKCLAFSNWEELMVQARLEKLEMGIEDPEEEELERLSEYFIYTDEITGSVMSSESKSLDAPRYHMDELYMIDPSGISHIAAGIIIDPDGDRTFLIGDSPVIEYGGLTYKLVQGYDKDAEAFVDISVGLNTESDENDLLLQASTEIGERILVKYGENPWGNSDESGWYDDYRYIGFIMADYSSLPKEFFFYLSDPQTGNATIEADPNARFVLGNLDEEGGGVDLNLTGGDVLIVDDNSVVIQSRSRFPMVLFVDASPQLKSLEAQVIRVSIFAGIAYVLIVAGAVFIELHKSKTPETESSGADGSDEEDEHISENVARALLSKITDVEQSMGPNGYLDQLREEIDSRRASREKPEEDS